MDLLDSEDPAEDPLDGPEQGLDQEGEDPEPKGDGPAEGEGGEDGELPGIEPEVKRVRNNAKCIEKCYFNQRIYNPGETAFFPDLKKLPRPFKKL